MKNRRLERAKLEISSVMNAKILSVSEAWQVQLKRSQTIYTGSFLLLFSGSMFLAHSKPVFPPSSNLAKFAMIKTVLN